MGNFIRVIIILLLGCIFPGLWLLLFFLPDDEKEAEKELDKKFKQSFIEANEREKRT